MAGVLGFGSVKAGTVITTRTNLIFTSLVIPARQRFKPHHRQWRCLLPTGSIPEAPIEWKKPPKLRFNHPWKTGDLVTIHPPVDMTKHPVMVENSKELETANDMVKKLFSFDFIGRKYAMRRVRDEMVNSIKNHAYDDTSLEVQIARKTAIIRNLNEHLETNWGDSKTRAYLHKIISKRKKTLTLIRKCDYKRFEWLLEKLDLIYQPIPEEFLWRTRKKSIRTLTEQYIENYKATKLSDYRSELEAQKEGFLKDKIASLEWMRKEETDCGVEPTVTEEEIEATRKKLEEHQMALRSRPVVIDTTANILKDA